MRLGQNNPKDQIAAGLAAIDGNLSNLEEGIGTPESAARNIRVILRALEAVMPHLEGVEWDENVTRNFK